jgi:hypothetical protein
MVNIVIFLAAFAWAAFVWVDSLTARVFWIFEATAFTLIALRAFIGETAERHFPTQAKAAPEHSREVPQP